MHCIQHSASVVRIGINKFSLKSITLLIQWASHAPRSQFLRCAWWKWVSFRSEHDQSTQQGATMGSFERLWIHLKEKSGTKTPIRMKLLLLHICISPKHCTVVSEFSKCLKIPPRLSWNGFDSLKKKICIYRWTVSFGIRVFPSPSPILGRRKKFRKKF